MTQNYDEVHSEFAAETATETLGGTKPTLGCVKSPFEDKIVIDREHLETISYCTKFQGVPACVKARVPVLRPPSFSQFEPSLWDGFSVSWERFFFPKKKQCMELTIHKDLMLG